MAVWCCSPALRPRQPAGTDTSIASPSSTSTPLSRVSMQADIAARPVQRRPPAPTANSSHGIVEDVVSMSLAASAKISAGENPSPAERFMDWQLIGSGGVADVFRVVDKELGGPLAIKILKQIHR